MWEKVIEVEQGCGDKNKFRPKDSNQGLVVFDISTGHNKCYHYTKTEDHKIET